MCLRFAACLHVGCVTWLVYCQCLLFHILIFVSVRHLHFSKQNSSNAKCAEKMLWRIIVLIFTGFVIPTKTLICSKAPFFILNLRHYPLPFSLPKTTTNYRQLPPQPLLNLPLLRLLHLLDLLLRSIIPYTNRIKRILLTPLKLFPQPLLSLIHP